MTDPSLQKWTTQLRKSVLTLLVLGLLREGPQYGYGMVAKLQHAFADGLPEGSIYPLLSRLEKQGLVMPKWVIEAQGPPRKYYSLTDSGRDFAERMLSTWKQVDSALDRLYGRP